MAISGRRFKVGTERAAIVRQVCQRLAADPIFAMSLGSKELFHSNLLGWFVERFPPVADAVAEAWALPGDGAGFRVRREWHHLDLVMEFVDHQPLVIENKMFALPDERQLDRYAAEPLSDVSGKPSRVLLSMIDPGWPQARYSSPGGDWQHRSYHDLRRVLSASLDAVAAADAYAAETLRRWIGLLSDLDALIAEVGRPQDDEALMLDQQLRDLLRAVRLDGAVQKMRYQVVAVQVRRRVLDLPTRLDIGAGLTNAIGLVQGSTARRSPNFMWQLQGESWRLAITFTEEPLVGRTVEKRSLREQAARELLDWFDFSALRHITGSNAPERPAQPAAFLRYDPSFVYRYVPVPGLTVGQAVAAGEHYSRSAVSRVAEGAEETVDHRG